MSHYYLQVTVPPLLEQTVSGLLAFLPRLAGALIILLIGWFVGRTAGRLVARIADRIELDKAVVATPLGNIMGGSERAVSASFGSLTKWFVFALAFVAAADVLAVELFSQWVSTAVSYLPAFVAGLFVIVAGFIVADFIGDAITQTRAATQTRYTGAFATGTRMFLYFVAVVIGLSTMGIDVSLLETFGQALAWGLAAALALGVGIALGWGGKDYVANHIESWVEGAQYTARESSDSDFTGGAAQADGGVVDED
jgi:MFS family permease